VAASDERMGSMMVKCMVVEVIDPSQVLYSRSGTKERGESYLMIDMHGGPDGGVRHPTRDALKGCRSISKSAIDLIRSWQD
jgi:hypothetical protein